MKKKLLCAVLVMACVAALAACGAKEAEVEEPEIVGGWTDEYTTEIPEEAQAAFDKAYEGYADGTITIVAYAGSQVVAGTNYKFVCDVTGTGDGAETARKYVTVYADLQGNATFMDFEDYTE